jgi:hypothetical protein
MTARGRFPFRDRQRLAFCGSKPVTTRLSPRDVPPSSFLRLLAVSCLDLRRFCACTIANRAFSNHAGQSLLIRVGRVLTQLSRPARGRRRSPPRRPHSMPVCSIICHNGWHDACYFFPAGISVSDLGTINAAPAIHFRWAAFSVGTGPIIITLVCVGRDSG